MSIEYQTLLKILDRKYYFCREKIETLQLCTVDLLSLKALKCQLDRDFVELGLEIWEKRWIVKFFKGAGPKFLNDSKVIWSFGNNGS